MTTLRWTGGDRLDDARRAGLLGPGGFFELVDDDVLGHDLPVFALRPRSLPQVVANAANHGDRPYLVAGERSVMFAVLPAVVDAVAHRLAADHGVRRGDRVGLAGSVTIEHAIAFWAIVRLGAIATTMNPAWTVTELAHAIGTTRPTLVLADATVLDRVPPSTNALDLAALAPTIDDASAPTPDPDRSGEDRGAPAPQTSPDRVVGPDLDEDDAAAIVFTSGTTGRAKGATLSHRNIVHFCLAAAATSAVHGMVHGIAGPSGPTVVLGSAPLFHVSGLLGQVVNAAVWGGTVVVPPSGRWDERVHLELTERHRVTTWSLVPTQLARLIDHPDLSSFDLTSLSMVGGGGATFSPELLRRTAERLPGVSTTTRVGYGMTETAGTVTLVQPPVPDAQRGSVGPPVAGTEIQVRDEHGRVADAGTIGEIWARSAQVFLGYWGDDAATAASLDGDRWYATGDFGRIQDGHLHLESRRRDLIIRGGENIYPIEIENRLVAHPAVADAAVVGIPDDVWGQQVRAVVVLREGVGAPSADELRAWTGAELARYKVPAVVDVVAELPRNATGKVRKDEL